MADTNIEIPGLIIKYLKNELSAGEHVLLEQWRQTSANNEVLFQSLTNEDQLNAEAMQVLAIDREAARKKAMELEFPGTKIISNRRIAWWKYMAAAAVLVLLLASVYYLIIDRSGPAVVPQGKIGPVKNEIVPGGNKAVLTLGDNRQIVLDDVQNGLVTQQGSASITKKDGLLEYYGNNSGAIVYNTLATPKGGQYQLVLPDGSKAWLNAASSIKYPVQFSGKDRKVEVQGEVFFEVTRNANQPFKVLVQDMEVEVLGTHFNVNAYSDEPAMQTTLLEGSVQLTKNNSKIILQPGQAGQATPAGNLKLIDRLNLDEVVAWKNGIFYFDHASIETIMRQVARWYNVEVVYQDRIHQKFNGEIPRNVPVSALFEILESTGWVHFKIDGRKIIVMQ